MRFVRNFVAVQLKKVLQNLICSGKFCSDKALCGVYKGLCFLQSPFFVLLKIVLQCFHVLQCYHGFVRLYPFACRQCLFSINKKLRCVLALCCKVSLSKQFFFGRGGRICTIAKINTIDFHLFDKYNSNIKRCSFYR